MSISFLLGLIKSSCFLSRWRHSNCPDPAWLGVDFEPPFLRRGHQAVEKIHVISNSDTALVKGKSLWKSTYMSIVSFFQYPVWVISPLKKRWWLNVWWWKNLINIAGRKFSFASQHHIPMKPEWTCLNPDISWPPLWLNQFSPSFPAKFTRSFFTPKNIPQTSHLPYPPYPPVEISRTPGRFIGMDKKRPGPKFDHLKKTKTERKHTNKIK